MDSNLQVQSCSGLLTMAIEKPYFGKLCMNEFIKSLFYFHEFIQNSLISNDHGQESWKKKKKKKKMINEL